MFGVILVDNEVFGSTLYYKYIAFNGKVSRLAK